MKRVRITFYDEGHLAEDFGDLYVEPPTPGVMEIGLDPAPNGEPRPYTFAMPSDLWDEVGRFAVTMAEKGSSATVEMKVYEKGV